MLVGDKNMECDYLYHYTSLQALALILKSKSIKFNSLNLVDDAEEKVSQDIMDGGKYCFVSSWTDDDSESIPMWGLYTQLSGVRIKLPKSPFKKYEWRDPLCNEEKIKSYFSLEYLYQKDIFPYLSSENMLQKVSYTDNELKLYPKLKEYNEHGFHIGYDKLGKYKRKFWSFQREWRYILYIRPVRLSDYLKSLDYGKRQYAYNIKNHINPHINEIYLNINEKSIKKMEILCAPKMSSGDKILLQCLVEKYCPYIKISESSIRLN